MKIGKKGIGLCLAAVLLASCVLPHPISAKSIVLKEKRTRTVAIKKGRSVTLKIRSGKKRAKWSIKSGKKYIHLSSRKKSSVKVRGIKKGTAKIQCRIGKKKCFCKVKVTDTEKTVKPTRTPQESTFPTTPTTEPTLTPCPTQTPTASPSVEPTVEPTLTPCPTHIPTEDRLMAEPQKKMELPSENGNGLIWYPEGRERYYLFGSDLLRKNIHLQFTNTNTVPDDAKWSIDVSEKQNGSVMAWYSAEDADGIKRVVIGQKGGVVANPDSSYLLCDIKSVSGLKYLYTTDVTNMSYMFLRYACGSEKSKLDLGERFETSKVENMEYMFQACGYYTYIDIYLGRIFDCSHVKSALGMMMNSWVDCFYVQTEELRNWLIAEDNHTFLNQPEERVIVQPQ